MLTREQKQQLNELNDFKFFFNERNGIALDNLSKEPVYFPNSKETLFRVIDQIRDLGFASITVLSSPTKYKANVILRVYSKRHQPYDCKEIHNLYGHYCFVRHWFSWITTSPRGDTMHRNPKKASLRVWFYQDEYVDYDCDFVDFYLKIK